MYNRTVVSNCLQKDEMSLLCLREHVRVSGMHSFPQRMQLEGPFTAHFLRMREDTLLVDRISPQIRMC